jgi:hypothetical protein
VGFYIPDFIAEGKFIVEIKAFATLHQKYQSKGMSRRRRRRR